MPSGGQKYITSIWNNNDLFVNKRYLASAQNPNMSNLSYMMS